MSNGNTTVSVDRDTTYPRLNDLRKTLSGDGPGEEATFEDAISHLLDEREESPEASEREGAAV